MAVTRVHGEHRDALVAGEDLSQSLFYAAKINSDKQLVLAEAGDTPYGFIFETAPQGRPATVATGGLVNAVAGGVIATAAEVSVAADGRVIATATAGEGFGYARDGATAANQVVEVYFK